MLTELRLAYPIGDPSLTGLPHVSLRRSLRFSKLFTKVGSTALLFKKKKHSEQRCSPRSPLYPASGFDEIAARRKVFKVETVGDCYVAVCGLPDPRKDHALVMARFANDCLNRMKVLTGKLEKMLGPDTG